MFEITRLTVNPFQENTYILEDKATRKAIVVDPGLYYPEEKSTFDNIIKDRQLKLVMIVNTHLHLDHCFGVKYIKDKYGVPLAANSHDKPLGDKFEQQCSRFGIKNCDGAVIVDKELTGGDVISVGDSSLTVLNVPGHTPGGIALWCRDQNFVLTGDSLFQGSVGRTDLEGGDHRVLINAITEQLLALPDETTVLSGHGEATKIGTERNSNPYI